jgi:hypothetical protein
MKKLWINNINRDSYPILFDLIIEDGTKIIMAGKRIMPEAADAAEKTCIQFIKRPADLNLEEIVMCSMIAGPSLSRAFGLPHRQRSCLIVQARDMLAAT